MGLGMIDILATNHFRQREQLDQLAEQLQRINPHLPSRESLNQ